MSAEVLDPIAQLEAMAKRQTVEQAASKALSKSKVQLVLGKDAKAVFFATLALRMKSVPDWSIDTLCTNGKELRYNPEFFTGLSEVERVGVLAHEVMHNAMAHPCRRGDRDHGQFNVACDLAINDVLRDAGYELPKGALFHGEGRYGNLEKGLAAEEYYSKLPQKKPGDKGGNQPGGDPGRCGAVEDAGDPSETQQTEAELRVAVAQAANAAKQKGKLPGGLSRLVDDIVEPKVRWQDVLREFVSRSLTAREDYSWTQPNRRFIGQGLYLPSLRSEAMAEIVVAIDTSGSIGEAELAEFAGELNGILECKPCKVSVVYCDSQVNKVTEWEPSDGPLTLEACGGGGTSHRPVWDWLNETGVDAACVVCLTDGYTDPGDDPGVPVLWAVTAGGNEDLPFGRVVRVE